MSDLVTYLTNALQALLNYIEGIPLHAFSLLCQGLAAVINWIPAPAFFADVAGWIGNTPPLAAWLLSALQIGSGATILVTAFTLRFLIRRIPFIG
jgi:hypothetical protein